MGFSTVSAIVKEVCKAIRELGPRYLPIPTTPAQWQSIADGFHDRWDCPNTLGCIDGKHIEIKKPAHSGSLYFNYKGYFSTVLMLICDSQYKIIYADVGSYGHEGDSGIFNRCAFKKAVEEGTLQLPPANYLPHTRSLQLFEGGND